MLEIIEEYNRIIKYTFLEKSTLIISLIYLNRICQNDILLLIHRLSFIIIRISIKIDEDKIYANGYYAQIVEVPLKDFNNIEREFNKF